MFIVPLYLGKIRRLYVSLTPDSGFKQKYNASELSRYVSENRKTNRIRSLDVSKRKIFELSKESKDKQQNGSNIKGVPKKTSLNLHRSFRLIYLATNMLKVWGIPYLTGEIHSSV